MVESIFPTRSHRSKYDPDIDSMRRPIRSPSSPLLITTSIAALKLSANTNKWLSNKVKSSTVVSADKCLENYKKVDFVSLGGFLKSCLCCQKKIADDDDIFMYRNLEAFCSQDCRSKYIIAGVEKQKGDCLDSTVSEAFKNYDVTKLRRLGK